MRTGRNPFGVYDTFPRRFPRVARNELPWVSIRKNIIYPEGVATVSEKMTNDKCAPAVTPSGYMALSHAVFPG
jgi:hypothetical protein